MARYAVVKIKEDMPGYGTREARHHPWLVFKGSQRTKARAFASWPLAMRYVDKQFSLK